MLIPPALKEMCLLTSVHSPELRAAHKICPLLAPRQPVQLFLPKVLRKETQTWKATRAS